MITQCCGGTGWTDYDSGRIYHLFNDPKKRGFAWVRAGDDDRSWAVVRDSDKARDWWLSGAAPGGPPIVELVDISDEATEAALDALRRMG
jgi:hypothetical protein